MTGANRNASGLAGAVALLCLAILPWGCGYRPGAAGRVEGAQSIAVAPLGNRTTTFEVEEILSRALARGFVEKSPYRVVTDESQADFVLRGEVLSVTATPVIFGQETFGTAFLVTLNARVELTDRQTGKAVFRNDNYVFREQYEINVDVRNFFSELNPALERIAFEFASSVVSSILEDF
jgi:hypothetical protein